MGWNVAGHNAVGGGVNCGCGTGWLPRKSTLGEQVGDLLRLRGGVTAEVLRAVHGGEKTEWSRYTYNFLQSLC